MKLLSNLLIASLTLVTLGGCATNKSEKQEPLHDVTIFSGSKEKSPAGDVVIRDMSSKEEAAYRKGLMEAVEGVKGLSGAREDLAWQPPIVQCGIRIPARVINGIFVPEHDDCITIFPSEFRETSSDDLPVLGDDPVPEVRPQW
jgi:hypothetical protein